MKESEETMRVLRFIGLLLMVIGAINWGLIGFFHYNLVGAIFGGMGISRIIFDLIGLAGIWGIALLCRCCGCGCKCGPKCKCCKK